MGLFRFFPSSPTDKIIISPLADMLSWAVWFKFLFINVIEITYLFTLTSFSKQSASWKVLEICELCALSTDSPKTYSVNKYMYTGSSSYSFDWGGGIIRWGGEETEKTPGGFNLNKILSLQAQLAQFKKSALYVVKRWFAPRLNKILKLPKEGAG